MPGVATTAVCLNIPGRATRRTDKLSNRHEAERTVHVRYQRSLSDRRISEFISLCDKELENTDYGRVKLIVLQKNKFKNREKKKPTESVRTLAQKLTFSSQRRMYN